MVSGVWGRLVDGFAVGARVVWGMLSCNDLNLR